MAQPRDTVQPLDEADMPPHLRERLEFEKEMFHHPCAPVSSLAGLPDRCVVLARPTQLALTPLHLPRRPTRPASPRLLSS